MGVGPYFVACQFVKCQRAIFIAALKISLKNVRPGKVELE
jgi:hypothetical protein